jgi:hypothetical protein
VCRARARAVLRAMPDVPPTVDVFVSHE